jgi:myo-inositol-1(or 4)-monophosphatase
MAGLDENETGVHERISQERHKSVKSVYCRCPHRRAFFLAIRLVRSSSQFMSTSTIHPMLNTAVKAARAAGAIINRAALDVEAVRVSQKQVNDFVTEVDQASERIIIETLLGAYPDHGILAEESGSTHGNPNASHVWIIDPLDGTTNFIHGFPIYCVSIALVINGKLDQAVVYDPTRNDLFTATRGRGAFLNDRRIRVSKRVRLNECLLSTGFPFRPEDDFNKYLRLMGDMMQRTAGLRRPGAAALDLAYVAAGFSDGFFELGLQPWDMAAGALLVTEAGGLVGNFTGEANFLEHRECMAANPRIYAQLVPLLSGYSKFGSAEAKREVSESAKTLSLSSKHD